ncbi:uncharacterized protein ARMOST_17051 [Armillaria ostoyae]|uniref:Uncharacterized protein n=1 Tax=Armillaria ostoyae TaxID=47428 RepID=A0A284RXX2_ARMOS|nr:uncharacterized protein ARMOST_17051 [Armillaria ostoyae]
MASAASGPNEFGSPNERRFLNFSTLQPEIIRGVSLWSMRMQSSLVDTSWCKTTLPFISESGVGTFTNEASLLL